MMRASIWEEKSAQSKKIILGHQAHVKKHDGKEHRKKAAATPRAGGSACERKREEDRNR